MFLIKIILVKGILCVHAVAVELQKGELPSLKRTDTERAEAVINTLKQHTGVDFSKITVEVEDGNITLAREGCLEYQCGYCCSSIEPLAGVRNVFNFITLRPGAMGADIKLKISGAFYRSATIDSGNINVDVIGFKASLRSRFDRLLKKKMLQRLHGLLPV